MLALGGLVASYVLPSLLTHTKLPAMPAVAALTMMVYPLVPIVGIAGLIMVLGSRAAPQVAAGGPAAGTDAEAFADTVIEGPAAIARWPAPPKAPLKPPRNRVRAAVVSFLGVAASAFVMFMGLVFASLGFQGRTGVFTGWVLPIATFCGVLYLSTVLWLYGKARHRLASVLAWAPVLLMVGMSTLMMVVSGIGMLIGK